VTTYRSFVDALEALVVVGVVRRYTSGPPSGAPGTADVPAQYVRYPGGEERALVFGEGGGVGTLRAELMVLVEPVAGSTHPRNFDATVDMMDNVAAALRGAPCSIGGKLSWSVRQVIDTVAGTDYWAVLASVEGH